MPRRHSVFPTVVVAALVLALAAPATAAPPQPKPNDSGLDQYVEMIPSGAGKAAPGVGKKRRAALSARAKAELKAKGGKDAAALEQIATSSDYGAPTQPLPKTGKQSKAKQKTYSSATRGASLVASSDGSSGLKWVIAAIAVVTAGAVAAFALRRRGWR
jgi:hypothetical protein